MNDRADSTLAARPANGRRWPTWMRTAGFFGLWVVLMPSTKPADLAFGVLAALAATWVSLRLAQRAAPSIRPLALLAAVPGLAFGSVRAGIDVARRAFDPRLPLRPGFVLHRTRFAPGLARNAFRSITSLLPGTLPTAAWGDAIEYHALDLSQPVLAGLRADEQRLAAALGEDKADD